MEIWVVVHLSPGFGFHLPKGIFIHTKFISTKSPHRGKSNNGTYVGFGCDLTDKFPLLCQMTTKSNICTIVRFPSMRAFSTYKFFRNENSFWFVKNKSMTKISLGNSGNL